ncbi:MAG: nucleotide exchange factor GrpE [Clostridia bacterium]|nr:nucleotide exchange factor GrpE [Clostridia bacterium]
MTDEIKNEETVVAQEQAAPEAPEAPAAEQDLETLLQSAELEKQKLQQQIAEGEDKYLRLAAEYDNFRKRSAKERDMIYGDAYADALAVFLPVLDNLERAAQFADGESVAKGVEMTLKGITDALERLGITEIEAQGLPFDPEVHNAVLHVEDETLGESVVAEVLQKGYRRGDRVLRYAMVKVAN